MATQSTSQDPVLLGVLSGIFLMIAASGAHWFITREAWPASALQRIGTGVQIVVGLAVAAWTYRRARRLLDAQGSAAEQAGDTSNPA